MRLTWTYKRGLMVPAFVLALFVLGLAPAGAEASPPGAAGSRVIYSTNGGLGQGYVPSARRSAPRDVVPEDESYLEEGYTVSEAAPIESIVIYTTMAGAEESADPAGLDAMRAARTDEKDGEEEVLGAADEAGGAQLSTDDASDGSSEDEDFLEDEDEDLGGLNGEEAPAVSDPLEGFNRLMFKVNDKLYFWVLRPAALGYSRIVPEPGRVAVKRFFSNIFMPVRFANNVLQFKFKYAAVEVARFVINTTVGVAGFMDPAKSHWNLAMHEEDFGQTLGFYGMGPGIYLNLPVFGPSNIRDTIGMVADIFLSPTAYILPNDREIVVGIDAYKRVNEASLNIGLYEGIKRDALDPYIFIRNAYQQHRVSEIKK